MKDDRLYLDHIVERIDRISRFVADGREAYLHSEVLQDAVFRNFEVIGEAVRKISSELREQYPDVPWQQMAAFRNVLIHDYDNVDLETVWRVITERLPALKPQIRDILQALDEKYGAEGE